MSHTNANHDVHELKKFSKMAHDWWDPNGQVKTLHQINPLRLGFILNHVNLTGANTLDVGCGGGLLSEALAKSQAVVTGIDLNSDLIKIAKLHLHESGLKVDYRKIAVEEFAPLHLEQFDVITCMELLEHVPQPEEMVHQIATLLKPGGFAFFSTLNRNLKSWLFAIVGAEYLLRLLPTGTHDYQKFIKPSELCRVASQNGLKLIEMQGIRYNPFLQYYSLTSDISVNYLACFQKI